jgi:hypothetical protein
LPGGPATEFPKAAALFRKLFAVRPLPLDAGVGTVGLHGGSDPVTVWGAGAGYLAGGRADSFHFAARKARDGDMLIAQITSMPSTATAQSGIMLRQSAAADASYVALFVADGQAVFQSRTAAGGAAVKEIMTGSITAPVWLKMLRRGNAVAGYKSSDGRNWKFAGSQTVAMTGTAYFGVAVSSGSATGLNTTAIDNVDNANIAAVDPGITDAIILDASGGNVPGVTKTGSWESSGNPGKKSKKKKNLCYGGDAITAWKPTVLSSVTCTPAIPAGGLYDVYLRWTMDSPFKFCDHVPVLITSKRGTTAKVINEKVGDCLWNYLGTYEFARGTSGNLIVKNTGQHEVENEYVNVDAVMFVPLPAR